MPGPLFHVGAAAMCPHGGQVTTAPGAARVLVGGQPAATMGDSYTVAGCAFMVPGPKPQPCVKVQWIAPATRVLIGGQPAILATSAGLCQSAEQIPGGPPSVTTTQTRVTGT
jgi:hypothetical protein